MQLLFTREELKLLAEVLEEQATVGADTSRAICQALLSRVIEHDMRLAFDELEDLQDILNTCRQELRKRLAEAPADEKPALSSREQLLEKVTDKVTEACAMV